MTPKAFQKLALSFDEAHEEPHFERTSFRVGKKIFATMKPDGSDAGQMNRFLHYDPPSNSSAPGAIGVKGHSTQTLYPFAQDCDSILWRNQKTRLTGGAIGPVSDSAASLITPRFWASSTSEMDIGLFLASGHPM